MDLLIVTDFVDAFVDIHAASGDSGEPVAKRNWYFLGQVDPDSEDLTEIKSVGVGTVTAVEVA